MHGPHKSITKWHLNQTRPELFLKVRCTDSDVLETFAETCPPDVHRTEESFQYPPDGSALTAVVLYWLKNKKMPAVLPKDICSPQNMETLPKHLIPLETFCSVPRKHPSFGSNHNYTESKNCHIHWRTGRCV